MPWRAEGDFGTRGEDGSRGETGAKIERRTDRVCSREGGAARFRLRDGKAGRVNDSGAI